MIYLITTATVLYMAFVSKLAGGSFINSRKFLAFTYKGKLYKPWSLVPEFIYTIPAAIMFPAKWYMTALFVIAQRYSKNTGHGDALDRGSDKHIRHQTLTPIVDFLYFRLRGLSPTVGTEGFPGSIDRVHDRRDYNRRYDIFFFSIQGIINRLPIIIICPAAWWIVIPSGLFRGWAYNQEFARWGEPLDGAIHGGALALAWYLNINGVL